MMSVIRKDVGHRQRKWDFAMSGKDMKLFKKPEGTGSPSPGRELVFLCEITELKTFAEKSKGLLGKEAPYGAYFRTRWGIHTFGMKFPIDVVIADEAFQVRKIKKSLSPGRLLFWNPRHANVFELPAGTAAAVGLQIGDALELRA